MASSRLPTLLLILMLLGAAPVAADAAVDLLIRGARVIDPETGLDAVRDVAVGGGRIVAIAPAIDAAPAHATVIDAGGRVLAPGFIDLHVHGMSAAAQAYQARDGVTTALELEWGYPEVGAFLASREGRARVHYGASVSHGAVRALAVQGADEAEALRRQLAEAVTGTEPLVAVQPLVAASFQQSLTPAERARAEAELRRGLAEGGIGIGMAHAYYPGAGRDEIVDVFRAAAGLGVPIFSHLRGRGLAAVQEVLANAAATGASLHVVHVNSTALGEIEPVLALLADARERGIDVSTEAYPYTAGSTSIQAALFDGDWQSSYGISYDGLQWQATGERLTADTFARYRREGGVVIIHMMQEPWVETAIATDWVMIASDGMPFAPGAHPRGAGTFARVLGRYVRERGVLDLPTAIAKMTLLPARRLEAIVPQLRRKGRVQVGADADLVIFDPGAVIDHATFDTGPRFSTGIDFVFVAGVAVVADGELVADAFPGRPIRGSLPGEPATR